MASSETSICTPRLFAITTVTWSIQANLTIKFSPLKRWLFLKGANHYRNGVPTRWTWGPKATLCKAVWESSTHAAAMFVVMCLHLWPNTRYRSPHSHMAAAWAVPHSVTGTSVDSSNSGDCCVAEEIAKCFGIAAFRLSFLKFPFKKGLILLLCPVSKWFYVFSGVPASMLRSPHV